MSRAARSCGRTAPWRAARRGRGLDITGLVFRRLRPDDASALAACFERNAVPEVVEGFDPFPLTAHQATALAGHTGQDAFFGAFAPDGAIAAFSMLRGRDEGYEIPSLGIFVDVARHGEGIGGWMLDRTLEAAEAAGAPAVRLSVYAGNGVAERLYRSRGFEETDRGRVQQPDGSERERVVMTRDSDVAPLAGS